MIVIFSKDRAFQLEACLRSLLAQCADAKDVPIRVLWTASQERHRQSYDVLRESLRPWSKIEFVGETNFRSDLIGIVGGVEHLGWRHRLVRFLDQGSAGWKRTLFLPLKMLLLSPVPIVMYVVDDSLFMRPFLFADCLARLEARDDALAFSLRLGRGLTYFYMGRCEQEVPELTPVDEASGIYEYRWPGYSGDYGYPIEVSSSLLKSKLTFARLLRKPWRNPNTLELAMANMSGRYKEAHPVLLTFAEPRAVSVPLNLVQTELTDNRHGGQDRYHPDALCELFLQGVRADLSALDRLELTSVHAEIELLPSEG